MSPQHKDWDMQDFLVNAPNIPKFGISLDTNNGRATTECYEDPARHQMYNVDMYYIRHSACRDQLLALIDKRAYNQVDPGGRVPHVVFCPSCCRRLGKRGRDQLLTWGRLYSFHDAGPIVGSRIAREMLGAHYVFPTGIILGNQNQLIGFNEEVVRKVDQEIVELLDDAEEGATTAASPVGRLERKAVRRLAQAIAEHDDQDSLPEPEPTPGFFRYADVKPRPIVSVTTPHPEPLFAEPVYEPKPGHN